MRNITDRPELEGFSRSCIIVTSYLLAAVVCIPLLVIGAYGVASLIAVTMVVIWLSLAIIRCHKKNRADWIPTDNWSPPRGQPPMATISASVPPAPPAPRMRRASEPTTPVTLPATTPSYPTSRYPQSLSARLSQAYYNHHDEFSSPIIASHSENPRSHISSSRTWHSPTSYPSSAPFSSSYRLPGHTVIPFAANVQPPAYLAVPEHNTGLPPAQNTTSATDEGHARVFAPSNDGLPSYEVAVSMRQPPAYEALRTPRDDGPTTND